MWKSVKALWVAGVLGVSAAPMVDAASGGVGQCKPHLAKNIPSRSLRAPSGTDFVHEVMALSGGARDAAVLEQLTKGNLPKFLRALKPVSLTRQLASGQIVDIVICVTPDYLAVGDDRDYVRVPMGLAAAARVAQHFGFLLPTTRMVDAIYDQAEIRLAPSPMPPTREMESTAYFWKHSQTVTAQRHQAGSTGAALTAGQKKDIVLTDRLRRKRGRVAIYGWHRGSGAPIQPLSTVHGAGYADYSHGVRLVSSRAYVNGVEHPLMSLLEDPEFAAALSAEGPIARPDKLLAAVD